MLFAIAPSAVPAEAKRLRNYVSCGIGDATHRPPASRSCPVGDLPER